MPKIIPDLTIMHVPGTIPAQAIWPDASAGPHVIPLGASGGDVTGPSNANSVSAIQGVAVAGQSPALNDVLTITAPGVAAWAPTAVTSAITQLTSDVLAGPGPGSVPATVVAIQGVAVTGAAASGQVLTATSPIAAHWAPPATGSAITQLTGDVVAGPGPGSVGATIASIQGVVVTGTPSAGQVLTATTPTAAHWATPAPAASKDYAFFFALMPGDNPSTIAVGAAVLFPQNGVTSAGAITRISSSTFNLATVGNYEITWQVSVSEAGQLEVALNGVGVANTVIGRATGTAQLFGSCAITTGSPNSVLSIINPVGNSTALTVTPSAGGASPVSATLSIKQL